MARQCGVPLLTADERSPHLILPGRALSSAFKTRTKECRPVHVLLASISDKIVEPIIDVANPVSGLSPPEYRAT
jgi:hypothetical protein